MSLLKLQSLIDSGKPMIYRNQIAIVKSFFNRNGLFEISVELDGKMSIFTKANEQQIELWLLNFKDPARADDEPEVNVASVQVQKQESHFPNVFSENRKQMQNLSQILLDDIQKIRENPSYVAQAKQVCNTVNAIVNITKLQIQMIKGE